MTTKTTVEKRTLAQGKLDAAIAKAKKAKAVLAKAETEFNQARLVLSMYGVSAEDIGNFKDNL